MTKSVKGKQGFQKIPIELKRVKRGVFYLTESEMKALKEHCKEIGTTPSILVRNRLQDIIG
jgi:Holliday junction resolvase